MIARAEDSDRTRTLRTVERDLDRVLFRMMALGGLPDVEAYVRRARRGVIWASEPPRVRVAVIGASTTRAKFGNKAVRAYAEAGFEVYPIHPTAPSIEGIKAYPTLDALPVRRLDRVSLYLPPEAGLLVLDQIARAEVGDVWLNPGADAPEVVARAEALGLNVIRACSILDVGAHPDQF